MHDDSKVTAAKNYKSPKGKLVKFLKIAVINGKTNAGIQNMN